MIYSSKIKVSMNHNQLSNIKKSMKGKLKTLELFDLSRINIGKFQNLNAEPRQKEVEYRR